ncbi:MAG: DUF1353 domain-containing protein [Cyanobacteria bacterium P01_H01_bin.74]
MTSFKQPQLAFITEGLYRIEEAYTYEWTVTNTHYKLVVPKGFETDIASVPRWAWSTFGILPDGLHRGAAILHDMLYRSNKPKGVRLKNYYFKRDILGNWENISHVLWHRENCDRLFMRVMKQAGVKPWKRWLMFKALRLFGWIGWQR